MDQFTAGAIGFIWGIGACALVINTWSARRRGGFVTQKQLSEAKAEMARHLINDVLSPFLDQRFEALPELLSSEFVNRQDIHQAMQQVATHQEVEAAVRAVVQRLSPGGQLPQNGAMTPAQGANVAELEQRIQAIATQMGMQS